LAEWAKRDHSVKARSRGGKNGQRLGGLLDDSYTRFATDALAPRSRGHGKKNKKKHLDKGNKEISGSPQTKEKTLKKEEKHEKGKNKADQIPFKAPPPGVPLTTKEQEDKWMKKQEEDNKKYAEKKAKKDKNKIEKKEKKAEKEGKKVVKKT
jgi:hypothetical protein